MSLKVPEWYKKLWENAKRSKAAAVKAKCLECSNWLQGEVKDCAIPECLLFPWRPFSDHPRRRPPRNQSGKGGKNAILAPQDS